MPSKCASLRPSCVRVLHLAKFILLNNCSHVCAAKECREHSCVVLLYQTWSFIMRNIFSIEFHLRYLGELKILSHRRIVNDRKNTFFDELTIGEWFQSFRYQGTDSETCFNIRSRFSIGEYVLLRRNCTFQSGDFIRSEAARCTLHNIWRRASSGSDVPDYLFTETVPLHTRHTGLPP